MATTASASSTSTLVAYFSTADKAHSALDALTKAGFAPENLGIASREVYTSSPASTSSATSTSHHTSGEPGVWDKVKDFFGAGTEAEPYAGETTGNSLNKGEVTYGEFGSDDVRGTLGRLDVPEEHSRYFGHRFGSEDEATVITVTAPGRIDDARAILERYGADFGEGAESYDYADTAALDKSAASQQNIRLYGEVLRVHKDRISAGEVRLRKEVYTEVQTVEVPVSREELVIERVAATGNEAVSGATFTGEEIRIPLSQEVASVDKHAVLREEVRVGKREVTDVESLDEEVRREELKIEDNTTAQVADYAKR